MCKSGARWLSPWLALHCSWEGQGLRAGAMGEDEAGMRLIEAGMIGDTAEMAAAVEAGAPVGYQDPGGQTALFWAAMEGHGEALDWLLEREAPVNAVNEGGQTALMGAAMRYAPHPPDPSAS